MIDAISMLKNNKGLPQKGSKGFNKYFRKGIKKDAKKASEAIKAKYTDAFAPDAVADVARASRTESRRSQREVKTGRSSTILSMRDDMGMDAVGIPYQRNLKKMEGASVADKLNVQKKGELAVAKKDFVSDLAAIGKTPYIKELKAYGFDATKEMAADAANLKKKAQMKQAMKTGGFKALSRIGGL